MRLVTTQELRVAPPNGVSAQLELFFSYKRGMKTLRTAKAAARSRSEAPSKVHSLIPTALCEYLQKYPVAPPSGERLTTLDCHTEVATTLAPSSANLGP